MIPPITHNPVTGFPVVSSDEMWDDLVLVENDPKPIEANHFVIKHPILARDHGKDEIAFHDTEDSKAEEQAADQIFAMVTGVAYGIAIPSREIGMFTRNMICSVECLCVTYESGA